MSEPRNGNGRTGVFRLAGDIATSLPPAFLGLLCINIAFLALLFLLIDRVQQHRAAIIDRLLTTCAEQRAPGK